MPEVSAPQTTPTPSTSGADTSPTPSTGSAATPGDAQPEQRFEDRFVASIRGVCQDPGSRAALRRAARRRPQDAVTAHRYLASWVNPGSSAHREAVLYQVAVWVAQYDSTTTPGSGARLPLGRALRAASRRRGGTGISPDTAESRLMAAGRASADGLIYQHLPQILSMVASTGQRVDYARLTSDLLVWPTHSPAITKRWLQDYFRADRPVNAATTSPPS